MNVYGAAYGNCPGPWRHEDNKIMYVEKGQWRIIAKCDGRNLKPAADYANARMMAAAPELLSALRELLADIDDLAREFSICAEISESSFGIKARYAIAKATGEPQ